MPGIFDNNAANNRRSIKRGKSAEQGMFVAVWILRSAGLAAHFDSFYS